MQPIDLIVPAFIAFLAVAGVSMVQSVRRGRFLCKELAKRFPSLYEELGRPYPGFLYSQRFTAYMQLVMQRGFLIIGDPYYIDKFEELRRREIRQIMVIAAGFAIFGAVAIWYTFVRVA